MKYNETLKLSFYNIYKKRRSYIKVFINFTLTFSIIFFLFFYSILLNNIFDTSINDKLSNNRLLIYNTLEKNEIDRIKELNGFIDIVTQKYIGFIEENIDCYIDGKQYKLDFNIRAVSLDSNDFPENVKNDFSLKFYDNYIKYGRTIENINEIVLPENFFDTTDISFSPSDIIGETFSLSSENISLDNYIIVGISDKRLSQLSNSGYIYPVIKKDLSNDIDCIQDISINNFYNSKQFIYEVEDIIGADKNLLYLGNAIQEQIKIIEGQKIFTNEFLNIVGVLVILILLINTTINQMFVTQQNISIIGIWKTIGLKNKNLFFMMFFEYLIISFISMILSYILSILFVNIIIYLYDKLLYISLNLTSQSIIISLIISFIFCIILSIIIAIIIINSFRRKQIIHLLKEKI